MSNYAMWTVLIASGAIDFPATHRSDSMNPADFPLQHLASLPLFDGLSDSDLVRVAQGTSERFCEKDEVVFLKGDLPTGLFAVASGMVKTACQSSQGEERVIGLVESGGLFGEAPLFLEHPHQYLAMAMMPARLLHIDRKTLLDVFDRSPEFSMRMLLHVAQCIAAVMRDLEDFRVFSPRERVARYLLDRLGDAKQVVQPITFPTLKHIFASRLGMTPESLSRAMRDLAEAGVIETGKQDIRILDGKRLAMLAG